MLSKGFRCLKNVDVTNWKARVFSYEFLVLLGQTLELPIYKSRMELIFVIYMYNKNKYSKLYAIHEQELRKI